MARIAFILLAHEAPRRTIDCARALIAQGNFVVLHFDRNACQNDWRLVRDTLKNTPRVHLMRGRVRCGWGQWSLCRATLEALKQGMRTFPEASHFYLVSGDCVPVTSAVTMQARLDAADMDHIEAHDFFRSDWIKTGLKAERLVYRHWFNERRQPGAFYLSLRLQQCFGLARGLPRGVQPRIGSQWWCLRRNTVEKVLNHLRRRRDIVRFFKTVWIPDEAFFQTVVAHLVPANELTQAPPTHLRFSDYGMPIVFHDDHLPMLDDLQSFFVRKVSPDARRLRARMWERFRTGDHRVEGDGGRAQVHAYLASRGRQGRRSPPAPWARGGGAAADRKHYIIVCKQWDQASDVLRQMPEDVLRLGHVFEDGAANLPDLGGLERDVATRRRYPALTLDLACRAVDAHAVAICVDPARVDVVRALQGAGAATRILLMETDLSEGFLAGHGARLGLDAAGAVGPLGAMARDCLRCEIEAEMEAFLGLQAGTVFRLRHDHAAAERLAVLMRFLDKPFAKARHHGTGAAVLEG